MIEVESYQGGKFLMLDLPFKENRIGIGISDKI
jgi:hypothetical protein